ncbi:MAG: tRNA pseudouridine(38-40) synthase TruA [Burkholderiaceae bacterium]|nr:tRNA pseudouridine(38-40) synthase TruA [Burkholderiaceae bacterium]
MSRLALGVAYRGGAYCGWQRQPRDDTVQARVEQALSQFADVPVAVTCAGRTDTGVHAINQVIHFDAPVEREEVSWVRGTNRYLPADVAIQWCQQVDDSFHARFGATGRRYSYLLLESPVRPALEAGLVGWTFRPLDGDAMRQAAQLLLGEHNFSAFRSSQCQAVSPVKQMRSIDISRRGAYWRLDFHASAFLHHMVRNIVGCLVAVGTGSRPAAWMAELLAARDREQAAPTFSPDGLYFVGPEYDPRYAIPVRPPASDWLP